MFCNNAGNTDWYITILVRLALPLLRYSEVNLE